MKYTIWMTIMLSPCIGSAQEHAKIDREHFNPTRYELNARSIRRALDTVAPAAPLLGSLGDVVPTAQSMAEILSGEVPSRLKRSVAYYVGAKAGNWLANPCGNLNISPTVDQSGNIHLFAVDSRNQSSTNFEFSFDGMDKAKSEGPWYAGTDDRDPYGVKLTRTSFRLDPGRYTLVTLKTSKPDGSTCYGTVRVTHLNGGIRINNVFDPAISMPTVGASAAGGAVDSGMDPYGMGALINAHRAAHGLPPVTYAPDLDGPSYQNNVEQANRGMVGHFYNPLLRDSVTRQNASRRSSAQAAMQGDGVFDQQGWIHSPDHNAALLDPNARFYGVSALSAAGAFSGRPASDQWWTLTLTHN